MYVMVDEEIRGTISAWTNAAPPGGRERPFGCRQVVLEAPTWPSNHGKHGKILPFLRVLWTYLAMGISPKV